MIIEFEFEQKNFTIQAKSSDLFKDVIKSFESKLSIEPNSLDYLINGNIIDQEKKVEYYKLNNDNSKMKVVASNKYKENNNDVIVQSKDIICPKCKMIARIKIDDHIKIFECCNNHVTEGIKIDDFPKTQNINISLIICGQCKLKNKGNTTNNDFYRCLTCKENICIICKSQHDVRHNIINYDQINYICPKHNDTYIKYCKQCNINMCFSCEKDHNNHKNNIISLSDYIPDIEKTKKRLIEIKKEIDEFIKQIKNIITKLNQLIKSMNIFYEINNNILNNYDIKNRNYELFQNINEITNNNLIYEKLKNINNNNDLKNKINNIIDLYKNINTNNINNDNNKNNSNFIDNNKNEITIIYKINNENKVKIFGDKFVKNNKNKCYMIIDNIKKEISEYIELSEELKKQKTIQIKLRDIQNITDMSYMFGDCKSLSSLPDIYKWDTKNITNMSYMFYFCESLSSLPDISKWDTKNVTNMRTMFCSCYSLSSLPDISKWDTKNVINMNNMFNGCESLSSLPDISKWDTKNVNDMCWMFGNCKSLSSLPDISKWDTKNVTNMCFMFENCKLLKNIPSKFIK